MYINPESPINRSITNPKPEINQKGALLQIFLRNPPYLK